MSDMYKTNNTNRLGVRTNVDWRQRPVSPTTSGATQSVAALQQQWRSQLQETPVKRLNVRYPVKEEVIFDQEPVLMEEPDPDHRSRSPSISRSLGSIHSPSTFSQESKVIKEGWLYRKNGLMQWKPVYAVAKHGNSVKPGGLYLYKDVKCANHIQTYDMSEVLEVAPRAQDYKQGIKWEIRMLVKREDVILGTDDIMSRKDWVDSLTAIMGKVSMATQNELTSRIESSEQMNRNLQSVAEELEEENQRLTDQCDHLQDTLRTKEHQLQQALADRARELKEALEKQEALFKIDCQTREVDQRAEFDLVKKKLESERDLFENESKQWRAKYLETQDSKVRREALEKERDEWRQQAEALGQDPQPSGLEQTLSDLKSNLQRLKGQEVQTELRQLAESLEEAKSGWKDLENDILRFLEREKEDAESAEASRRHGLSLVSQDIQCLRDELVGTSKAEDEKKLLSLTEKVDVVLDMIEHLQIGQTRLASQEGSGEAHSLMERMDDTMLELIKNQEQSQEEQAKHIKTIGHYLQLMTTDIQNSAIPDLPALSQQLEDVVERLEATDSRLSKLGPSTAPKLPADTQPGPVPKDTEQWMEQAMSVIQRYEAGNHALEDIVRRAVKGASKLQIEQVTALQAQHSQDQQNIDTKIQRYEENARSYFDRSIEKMHSDLHEFTGVMYEMLERLVLQALEGTSNPESSLAKTSQHLQLEIEQLQQEKESLQTGIRQMKQDRQALESYLEQQQQDLCSLQSEYKELARSKQTSLTHLSKELEPLMHQIQALKKLAGVSLEDSEQRSPIPNRNSRFEEEPERTSRFPAHPKGSSQFSDPERLITQPALKSPLVGARERPRGKSPLANFLNRK